MAKVIVVDDCKDQQEFLAGILRADGHNVQMACNARDALRAIQSAPFDMVLTDIFMPDCDGLELIREIRTWDGRILVVAITAGIRGGGSELFMKTAEALGANLALDKRSSPRAISAAISQILNIP
jgi:CheY-like chemotaxis protein